jgi:tRNA nucleotidyltransferase (CCA-adding enzyme)
MSEIALTPPAEVVEIARTLERAGFETWCVGGAIRDALLGHRHLDWDLATAAHPADVQRLFRRTVPVGIQFGTVGGLDRRGVLHEVTTFRRDVRTDGRHAEVEFGASLEEDLARRDFTINAIAWSPTSGTLRDPFGGREDLERRVVRAVGVAAERMREDRLRALRAIRFAARLGFSIEPETWRAIVGSAPFLGRLSRERVRQELEKTMEQVARPAEALALWRDSGALEALVPGLAAQDALAFASLDCLPPPGATAREERRSARARNRIAALFLGQDAGEVRAALKDLRFSNQQVAWSAELAAAWLRLGARMERALMAESPPSPGEVRRWAAEAGRTRAGTLMRLAAARWAAKREAGAETASPERVRSAYRALLRAAYHDPIEVADLAIDGEALMEAGFAPGPALGMILRALLERVVDDPGMNTPERLMELAEDIRRGATDR